MICVFLLMIEKCICLLSECVRLCMMCGYVWVVLLNGCIWYCSVLLYSCLVICVLCCLKWLNLFMCLVSECCRLLSMCCILFIDVSMLVLRLLVNCLYIRLSEWVVLCCVCFMCSIDLVNGLS